MKVNRKFIEKRMIDVDIKSKKELLEKIKMQHDTFNKKISGLRDWKLNELWMLSQVLDCEISDMLIKKEEV